MFVQKCVFVQSCVFVLVLSTVLIQSDAYHSVFEVDTDLGDLLVRETRPADQQDTESSLEDQQDTESSLEDQQDTESSQGDLQDEDVSLSNQQYDLSEEEEEEDVSPPEEGEEIWVTSIPPLSNMEENSVSASLVWVLFLAVPMVLLVVMSSMAVVYYLFVWRGGRMGYKAQRELLYKT